MKKYRKIKPRPPAGYQLPGSLFRRTFKSCDYDFHRRKERLQHLLPVLPLETISRNELPFHTSLLKDLVGSGYGKVADEISAIMQNERFERKSEYMTVICNKEFCRRPDKEFRVRKSLTEEKEKFFYVAEKMSNCEDAAKHGNWLIAADIRRSLAEKLLEERDFWLAEYFYNSCFKYTSNAPDSEKRNKIEAEAHCVLAYFSKKFGATEHETLEIPLQHLAECRKLSKNKTWSLKSQIIELYIENPLTHLGLTKKKISMSQMHNTIYYMACLMEHDVLVKLSEAFDDEEPENKEIVIAHKEEVLEKLMNLSREVNDEDVLRDTLIRSGLLQLEKEDFVAAQNTFENLYMNANSSGNILTQIITSHLIGKTLLCNNELQSALENFCEQTELRSSQDSYPELLADGLTEIGFVLLQEGQLTDAKEVFIEAYRDCKLGIEMDDDPSEDLLDFLDRTWAMAAISDAFERWARYSHYHRSTRLQDTHKINEWKTARKSLKQYDEFDNVLVPVEFGDSYKVERVPAKEKMAKSDMAHRSAKEMSESNLTPKGTQSKVEIQASIMDSQSMMPFSSKLFLTPEYSSLKFDGATSRTPTLQLPASTAHSTNTKPSFMLMDVPTDLSMPRANLPSVSNMFITFSDQVEVRTIQDD